MCRAAQSPVPSVPSPPAPIQAAFLFQLSCGKRPFRGLLGATLFTFLCVLLVIFMFKMVSKHSEEVPYKVPKLQKPVMPHGETKHVK